MFGFVMGTPTHPNNISLKRPSFMETTQRQSPFPTVYFITYVINGTMPMVNKVWGGLRVIIIKSYDIHICNPVTVFPHVYAS